MLRQLPAPFAVLFLAAASAAQCGSSWQGLSALPGTDGTVRALALWDRDGAGPLLPRMVVGGAFDAIGSVRGRGLAAYDPASGDWSDFGAGVTFGALAGAVHAIAAMPNGDLVVGGRFTAVDGVAANGIARWDGVAWHPFGSGIGETVHALAVLANGDVIAGGAFAAAGGSAAANIARWDGTAWQPLGQGCNQPVLALAVLPSGDLLAGGSFTASGALPLAHLGRWDGSSWTQFGSANGGVTALGVAPNGDVYVAGGFAGAFGVNATGIARWDGSVWSNLGGGATNPVVSIAFAPNGDVLIGGLFVAVGGVPAARVARWNGSNWSPLGSGVEGGVSVRAVAVQPDGRPWVGGEVALGPSANCVRRFDGGVWGAVDGTDGSIQTSRLLANGDLVVGGSFRTIASVPAKGLARRSGGAWSEVGGGVVGTVLCVLELANGDLLVGGSFSSAGGVAAANIARWNGSSWSALGAGLPAAVHCMVQRPNGQIVVGGAFFQRVVAWSGSAWLDTGVAGGLPNIYPVRAMALLPSGDVVVGSYQLLGATVFGRWDGTAWTPMPGVVGVPNSLVVAQNGDLLATVVYGNDAVVRWNGSSWLGLGGPPVLLNYEQVVELPNGDLVLGGTANYGLTLYRSSGSGWFQAGPAGTQSTGSLRTITREADGSWFCGGDFTMVAPNVASRMARLVPDCLPTVATVGAGCSGNQLTAMSLPWVGSTFRSTASGLPTNGIAVEVLGFAPASVPLASLLPQGQPGCDLLLAPSLSAAQLLTAGSVGLQFAVPNDVALAGAQLWQQVLAVELDAQANLAALTACNALQLVVGAF